MSIDTTFIGVLRMVLHIPRARSLKDGRQVLVSLRDRVRHRFDVSVNEVEAGEIASRRVLVVTAAGSDGRLLRSTLDKVLAFAEQSVDAVIVDAAVDVFPWTPPGPWMAPVESDEDAR